MIGLGVKNSTSDLLIENCDEFIFYEDLVRGQQRPLPVIANVPEKVQECFALLVDSVLALQRENKEVLWGSMVKETMKRKKPSFNETYYGFRTFSHLLEDAQRRGIVVLRRDQKSGSYVVEDLGAASVNTGTARSESAARGLDCLRFRPSGRGERGPGAAPAWRLRAGGAGVGTPLSPRTAARRADGGVVAAGVDGPLTRWVAVSGERRGAGGRGRRPRGRRRGDEHGNEGSDEAAAESDDRRSDSQDVADAPPNAAPERVGPRARARTTRVLFFSWIRRDPAPPATAAPSPRAEEGPKRDGEGIANNGRRMAGVESSSAAPGPNLHFPRTRTIREMQAVARSREASDRQRFPA